MLLFPESYSLKYLSLVETETNIFQDSMYNGFKKNFRKYHRGIKRIQKMSNQQTSSHQYAPNYQI